MIPSNQKEDGYDDTVIDKRFALSSFFSHDIRCRVCKSMIWMYLGEGLTKRKGLMRFRHGESFFENAGINSIKFLSIINLLKRKPSLYILLTSIHATL